MAGGIGLADVGFDFDDRAGGNAGASFVHEHAPDEVPRNLQSRARVEGARENHRDVILIRSMA